MTDALQNIISLSGGKDSTAMLIEMIRRGHDFENRFAFEDRQKPLFSAPPFRHIHPVGVF